MTERGRFIALEGLDGSGKTTQAGMLAKALQTLGYDVVLTPEPGGTEPGKKIRDLIMDRQVNSDPKVALLLFLADRSLHIQELIVPTLNQGKIVICDRDEASTIAYQCFGEGLSISQIRDFNHFVTGGLKPELTIVIDIPPEEAIKRARSGEVTHYDERPLDFYRKVRKGFLWQATLPLNEKSWVVVDGQGSPEEVHQKVLAVLKNYGIINREEKADGRT